MRWVPASVTVRQLRQLNVDRFARPITYLPTWCPAPGLRGAALQLGERCCRHTCRQAPRLADDWYLDSELEQRRQDHAGRRGVMYPRPPMRRYDRVSATAPIASGPRRRRHRNGPAGHVRPAPADPGGTRVSSQDRRRCREAACGRCAAVRCPAGARFSRAGGTHGGSLRGLAPAGEMRLG